MLIKFNTCIRDFLLANIENILLDVSKNHFPVLKKFLPRKLQFIRGKTAVLYGETFSKLGKRIYFLP